MWLQVVWRLVMFVILYLGLRIELMKDGTPTKEEKMYQSSVILSSYLIQTKTGK